MTQDTLGPYLQDCRGLVLGAIEDMVPEDPTYGPPLYDLVLDYPRRQAKALRPALAIATCRALGGQLSQIAPTAAVLELYHSAFLVHDDIEDDSELRRGGPTLHRSHGIPVAINVGDAMLALALEPLLDNVPLIGLSRSLRILRAVARMARLSAEGQALELDWIRRDCWDLQEADYVTMVVRKTAWYTFITPVELGAIVADAPSHTMGLLRQFGQHLGIAFQVQDDVLNLTAAGAYGKEIGGDLWEGKRTLILLHALGQASAEERAQALAVLARPRPGTVGQGPCKTEAGVRLVDGLIRQQGSIEHARAFARDHATQAGALLAQIHDQMPPSVHRRFLEELVDFVIGRAW